MIHQGKLAILAIAILAIGLSGFAVWHHYRQGRRVLEYWGSDKANLVRHAPEVYILELGPPAQDGEHAEDSLAIEGESLAIVQRHDISDVPGLIHARHALIQDSSYRWDREKMGCQPHWEFALAFRDRDRQATVAIDTRCDRALLIGQSPLVANKMIAALHEFVKSCLNDAKANPTSTGKPPSEASNKTASPRSEENPSPSP